MSDESSTTRFVILYFFFEKTPRRPGRHVEPTARKQRPALNGAVNESETARKTPHGRDKRIGRRATTREGDFFSMTVREVVCAQTIHRVGACGRRPPTEIVIDRSYAVRSNLFRRSCRVFRTTRRDVEVVRKFMYLRWRYTFDFVLEHSRRLL